MGPPPITSWVVHHCTCVCMYVVGEEMCYQLSKMGAKLILSARNEQKLEQVKSSLANPGDAR